MHQPLASRLYAYSHGMWNRLCCNWRLEDREQHTDAPSIWMVSPVSCLRWQQHVPRKWNRESTYSYVRTSFGGGAAFRVRKVNEESLLFVYQPVKWLCYGELGANWGDFYIIMDYSKLYYFHRQGCIVIQDKIWNWLINHRVKNIENLCRL
jgi:hypothetical protein